MAKSEEFVQKKDEKLLYALELDARISFQELGKKCGLSKETAINRVKALEKKEIIGRYVALVDFAKIGYTGFAVYCRFEDTDPNKRKEIIAYLTDLSQVYWISLIGGSYDIAYGILAKSVMEFNTIQYVIRHKYGKQLAGSNVAIRVELRHNKREYLARSKPQEFQPPFFGGEIRLDELDSLDSSILTLLAVNARIPATQIALSLKESTTTVIRRIRSLEEREIIQGYWTYIRPQKYGMQSYRLLLKLENMTPASRNALFSYVHYHPQMLLAIETVGDWQFEVTLEVKTHEELQNEVTKLRDAFRNQIIMVNFIIMFEDDLVYDPYPFFKAKRTSVIASAK